VAWQDSIRALHVRNYRIFFYGQGFSLIGTWMQRIALNWLVYRLTRSPLLLGVLEFAGQIPGFLLSPVAGVLLDRWDRKRVVLVTQTLSMIQAFLLAWLVLTDLVRIEHVMVLAVLLGLINAFDMPGRQMLVLDMLQSKEYLSNAIALNSFLFNAARFVGPSVAGMLIVVAGEGPCFLINGLSFIAVIISLFYVKTYVAPHPSVQVRLVQQMREGWSYTIRHKTIRLVLLVLAIMSLVALPYMVLLAPYVAEELHGGSDLLGFLTACIGVGALCGAYFLASRKNAEGLEWIILLAMAASSSGIAGLGLIPYFPLTCVMIAMAGFGMMVLYAAGNTLLQTLVDDDKRGRIMSLYTMTFLGMNPVGALLAGTLAEHWHVRGVLLAGGIICLLATLVYYKILKRMPKECSSNVEVDDGQSQVPGR
jgi:MFS family permease